MVAGGLLRRDFPGWGLTHLRRHDPQHGSSKHHDFEKLNTLWLKTSILIPGGGRQAAEP